MKKHVESLLSGVWINDSEGLRSKLIEKKRSGFEMTGFRSGQLGKFFLGLPCEILKVHKPYKYQSVERLIDFCI